MDNRSKSDMISMIDSVRTRRDYIRLFAFSAALVALVTTIIFMQIGIAINHTEQVLDCHYTGVAAHRHDQSCYDAEGNLVCPLPERELHEHSESCYDDEGNLICGREEVLEEHVHGPGCFVTVTHEDDVTEAVQEESWQEETQSEVVQQEEASSEGDVVDQVAEVIATQEQGDTDQPVMPAQSFEHSFLDENDNLVLRVLVEAPEGALPQDTTMRASWIDPASLSEREQMAVDQAVAEKTEGKITEQQAVDISFFDVEGNEIEPAEKLTVTFTSALVDTQDQPMVVHVDNLTEAQARVMAKGAAEPERTASVVNALDEIELRERDMSLQNDQLAFENNAFSTYVLAVTTKDKELVATDGESYTVTVSAPAAAGVSQSAQLLAHEYGEGDGTHDACVAQITEAMGARPAYIRLFDLSIINGEHEVQPESPVQVQMELNDLADLQDEVHAVHLSDAGAEILDVSQDGAIVSFDADGFSIYAIVGTTIEKTVLASDGQNYRVTATYGPETGIPENVDLSVEEILPAESLVDGETDAWQEYASMVSEALGWEGESASYLRLFDIKIVDKEDHDVRYQPASGTTVDVRIELADKESSAEASENTRVVHIADGATAGDVVDALEIEGNAVCFEAEGFSVYAVVTGPEIYEPSAQTAQTMADLIGEDAREGFYLSVTYGGNEQFFTNSLNNKNAFKETTAVTSASTWYLEAVGETGSQFKIYTYINGTDDTLVKQYIRQQNDVKVELADDGDVFEISQADSGKFNFKLRNKNMWLQHSGSGNGIRLYKDKNNTANSSISLTYASSMTIPDDVYKLDGKTYGLINYSNGVSGEALMAEAKNSTSLVSLSTLVRSNPENGNESLYVAQDSDISQWTFHSVGQDLYTLSATVNGVTKYLKIGDSGLSLVSAEDASEIQFLPGTGEYAGQFRLTANGKMVSFEGTNGYKVTDASTNAAKQYLSFTELSDLTEDDFVIYCADKVSVSDTEKVANGTSVLLYKRVWNDTTKKYEYYAIDQNGGLVPCYESGDSIEWVGTQLNTLLWEFTEYHYEGTTTPNNYYELYNPYSGKYLAPQIEDGQILSGSPIGINLSGRRYGDYSTTIMAWDDSYYAYAGLKSEDGSIISCPVGQAEEFYFAVMHPTTSGESLTEVDTIDHTQYGVTMRIKDYGTTAADRIKVGNIDTSREQNDVLGETVYEQWNVRHLVSTNLGEDGYPTCILTNRSLSKLYEGAETVNHLFLEGTYNGTGYYEYDSTQNFATLQEDGNFVVYKELGTTDSSSKASLKHGQFMPYDTIQEGVYASVNGENLYDAEQNPLSNDDPRKYEKLHLVRKPNYFYGIELEASFIQTPSGLDAWGHDIIYEFTGDDDFWLYVDGELVIDLGGIHSALPGKVNYSTGEVEVNGTKTTLYDVFRKNYAERKELAQDAQEVTEYLNDIFVLNDKGQHIFKDYSTHTMKIFYMERGAGAANLHMRFNLTAVRPDQVLLQKKISGTDQQDYNLAEYAYQVFYRTESSGTTYRQLGEKTGSTYNVTHPNTNAPVTYLSSYTPPGATQIYHDVFFLTPGETVAISLPEDTVDYYIVECGVNTEVYDQVQVNDEEVTGQGSGKRRDYQSSAASVTERQRVVFDNHVNENAIRTLSIKKKLYQVDGVTEITGDPTAFTFRLYLGNENDDTLNPAYMQEYCVKDPSGAYCSWDNATRTFVSLGKTAFDQLTDDEKIAATFHTSTNGMIDKIPANYQVEVSGLLAGTKFMVEERPGEIPAGYAFIGYERNEGSYIVEEGDTVNAGTIRANESPSVFIKNKRGFGLTIKKEWSDASFMQSHGDVYFAVYVNGVFKEGTVRRLKHPSTSIYYYFDTLVEGADLSDYAVKEVVLTGDGIEVAEDGSVSGYETVTPIGDKGTLKVSATQKGATEAEQLEYRVVYETGTPTGVAKNARTDTATNTRHGIRLIKQTWGGAPLAGSVFTLTDAEGNPVGAGRYTSDENGLITIAYVNLDTDYTLTEVSAPQGWHALESPLKFRLNSRDATVSVTQGDADWYKLTQESGEEMASITLKNRPMTLRAIKYGAQGSQAELEPLSGATFELLYEVTVGGITGYRPVEGKGNLVSEEDTGIIPGIDETLAAGTYCLNEKSAPEGYRKLDSMIRFTIDNAGCITLDSTYSPRNVQITADVQDDGTLSYVLEIPNSVAETLVRLQKIGVDNGTETVIDEHLGGAVFTIYTDADHRTKAKGSIGGIQKTLEDLSSSETDGIFFDGGLDTGTYYLCETDSPDGYYPMLDDVIITVDTSGVSVWKSGTSTPVTPDSSDGSYTIQVKNYCGYELPASGGMGTLPLYLLGLALMAGGSYVLYRRRSAQ